MIEKRGDIEKMTILIIGIWVFAAICIAIMKKIHPKDKIYPIWAAGVAVLMTLYLINR